MIRDLCPDIEMQEVADMTKPQMLDFCNMKLHVLREEALSSTMKVEFAKSQLLSCESLLLDFHVRLEKMEEELKQAENHAACSDRLLQLKNQELERLLQRRESMTSTYIDSCRRRYSGMSMKRLESVRNFPDARVRVLTNFHSFQELSFFYHAVINGDGAMDRLAIWGSEEGAEKKKISQGQNWKASESRRARGCLGGRFPGLWGAQAGAGGADIVLHTYQVHGCCPVG